MINKKFIYKIDRENGGIVDFRILKNGSMRIVSESPLTFSQINSFHSYKGEKHHFHKSKKANEVKEPETKQPTIEIQAPIYDTSEAEAQIASVEADIPATFATPPVKAEITESKEENIEVGDKIEISLLGSNREAKILQTFEDEGKIKVRISGSGEELVISAGCFIKKL